MNSLRLPHLAFLALAASTSPSVFAFQPIQITSASRRATQLRVGGGSVGLGPAEPVQGEEDSEPVAGVDYEIPNHEEYRLTRRSSIDERCDDWYRNLLGDPSCDGILTSLATDMRTTLSTPVPLVNEERLPVDHEDWTPYVTTKLPWTPLVPAYGLEEFGLPAPRRNAEAWRQFDVMGMISEDYSNDAPEKGDLTGLSDGQIADYSAQLQEKGGWIADDDCEARLVYINGRFAPQLSKSSGVAKNMDSEPEGEVKSLLSRLTDGYTDELAAPVPDDDEFLTSFKKLSGPHHSIGNATTQFAINTQQGSACFAALNTIKTNAVAYVRAPAVEEDASENEEPTLVYIINAITGSAGAAADIQGGINLHPRCLVVAEKNSKVSVVQASVDLDDGSEEVPKLFNGFSQIYVHENATVKHSYLEETGGLVTASTELSDAEADVPEGELTPRQIELQRPAAKNTYLETIDVQMVGDDGNYDGTILGVGGNGRSRIVHSATLLRPGSHVGINGFSLAGGSQRNDIKTNIHHIAQDTTSRQNQKNMIGGRAGGAFRGRIRVEQSAQQTDSQQLSRSILLTDKCKAWAVPSLEIIADDVQCTHGTTVSDLSEEELFYLRSRGLDRTLARNLLMYAFAGDVCGCVDPSLIKSIDTENGLQQRVIRRLENVVPQGDRAIKGEFQSV